MSNIRKINEEDFFLIKTSKEKIKFLLRYAILAPSTHNSQPWLFKIGNSSCKIYINPKLKLKETDPKGRDQYISIGCCIENLKIIATYFNVLDHIEYPKANISNLVVIVYFKKLKSTQKADEELYPFIEAIKKRINMRGIFKRKLIHKDIYRTLTDVKVDGVTLHIINDKEKIFKIASLTAEAIREAYNKKSFRQEMSNWFISNSSTKKQGIPGYSIRMPLIISLIFPIIIRLFNIGSLLAIINRRSISSAPALFIITAKESNPYVWIQTGRMAEYIFLKLKQEGISTSIYIASIEIGNIYSKLQKIIGTNFLPQCLFCAGYMTHSQKFTPRHDIDSKLMT